jgi:hypothetical protein
MHIPGTCNFITSIAQDKEKNSCGYFLYLLFISVHTLNAILKLNENARFLVVNVIVVFIVIIIIIIIMVLVKALSIQLQ